MTLPLADTTFAEASWVLVVKALVIFAVIFAIVPVLTVIERKALGRFQAGYGPNRVGKFGLMQPLADAIKLIGKEAYRPQNALPLLWALGPILVVFSGVTVLAILPWGDVQDVGSGPVGLYAAYYAGFRGMTAAVIDSLPEPGGQVAALYPEKLIYDVAGLPGDITEYPGKVRLISVGFGEAALAVNNAAVATDPSAQLFPGHSTVAAA